MNAKKIMGAVLVALLAAALFVGAGAAADYGTVFTYQNTSIAEYKPAAGQLPDGVWTNGAAQVTVTGGVAYPGANFVAGTYKYGDHKVFVAYPTATYAPTAKIGGTIPYLVSNNGIVYNNTELSFVFGSASKIKPVERYLMTFPNGTALNLSKTEFEAALVDEKFEKGTYKIQAIFGTTGFVSGVPNNLLLDSTGFTYTIVGEDDATMTASANTLYAGDAFTLTIKGTPGVQYQLVLENVDVKAEQFVTLETANKFFMPNNGEVSFQASIVATAGADDDVSVTLKQVSNDKEIEKIELTVSAAVITATLGAPSYYVGDVIKISGTSTAGITDAYGFNITGTNFKETDLTNVGGENKVAFKKTGKEWEVEITTEGVVDEAGKHLDVGTYTLTLVKDGKVFKTIAVALKQPFISIVEAPEVIVQGTEAKFTVNAEAADGVQFYVFGTNFFFNGTKMGADKDTTNQFTLKLSKENTSAKNMSAGQYFAVFQHPMYNQQFNIMVDGQDFFMNTEAGVTGGADDTFLFNVYSRQTANAAQALCDALDNQNIDDMYVKYSFFVVGEDESFTISEIPTQVVKGDKIVISGVDTANDGETVKVEMISTAFAAVPKEEVSSAAFIVVTTDIAKDGSWEVTLDTSDLNVDEYALSVVIKDATKKNVNVNVVEAEDKPVTPEQPEQPENPEQPEEPVAPETPGFGALAALAGLGAVAVLLLRRE